jgi:hypothetical protein
MKNNSPEFVEFFNGYVKGACFTFSEELSTTKKEHFSPRALEIMEEDCQAFYNSNLAALQCVESTMEQSGFDFWCTRCGHGVGFWDKKYKSPNADLYDILDLAAKKCHECEVYIDDNIIEVYGR